MWVAAMGYCLQRFPEMEGLPYDLPEVVE